MGGRGGGGAVRSGWREVSQDAVIYVWPLGMAQQDYHSHNKTHIVRLSIWIWYFYLLWPNQAEFNSRAASDIKLFSTAKGTVGCPCLMSEKQKGTSVHSSKRRIREMNVSVSRQWEFICHL